LSNEPLSGLLEGLTWSAAIYPGFEGGRFNVMRLQQHQEEFPRKRPTQRRLVEQIPEFRLVGLAGWRMLRGSSWLHLRIASFEHGWNP